MRFTVAFDEADGEGIVFFGNYFRLAHRALESYFPEIGIPWSEWFKNDEFGVPLRHAEAEYVKPLRPGQTFEAKIEVLHLGESSVQFSYEFLGSEGESLARLKTSHVFISRKNKQKQAIPETLRLRLQAAQAKRK